MFLRLSAARAAIDDRPRVSLDERHCRQALLQMDAPRLSGIANGGEPGRLQETLEPRVNRTGDSSENGTVLRAHQPGSTTTYRPGSSPSLRVDTPSSSWSRRCTIRRSTEDIGSSSAGSPLDRTRSALRIAS